MATHKIITPCKVYLNKDLTGGERGTLLPGTEVTVLTSNDIFNTLYITDPQKGWVDANYAQKIVVEVPPEIPPITLPAIMFEPAGIIHKFYDSNGNLVATYRETTERRLELM